MKTGSKYRETPTQTTVLLGSSPNRAQQSARKGEKDGDYSSLAIDRLRGDRLSETAQDCGRQKEKFQFFNILSAKKTLPKKSKKKRDKYIFFLGHYLYKVTGLDDMNKFISKCLFTAFNRKCFHGLRFFGDTLRSIRLSISFNSFSSFFSFVG